jgi:hypothetical protein
MESYRGKNLSKYRGTYLRQKDLASSSPGGPARRTAATGKLYAAGERHARAALRLTIRQRKLCMVMESGHMFPFVQESTLQFKLLRTAQHASPANVTSIRDVEVSS